MPENTEQRPYPVYTDPNVAPLAKNARTLAKGDWSAWRERMAAERGGEKPAPETRPDA